MNRKRVIKIKICFDLLWENYFSISFQIEWDMIEVTVFLSILNQMELHLGQNREENCHHDHIPINVKGNGILVCSVQRIHMGVMVALISSVPYYGNVRGPSGGGGISRVPSIWSPWCRETLQHIGRFCTSDCWNRYQKQRIKKDIPATDIPI